MITLAQRDSYLQRAPTRVLRLDQTSAGWAALLEDSVLFPEGGGQPSDQGTLNGVAVHAVSSAPGGVLVQLAAPVEIGPGELVLDWSRRFDHMQQHTGQHLLTALAADTFGWATTSFHLHPGLDAICDIELDAETLDPERLQQLQDRANAEIRAARPVRARESSPQDLPAEVRSRGLPEGLQEPVRLVEIEGIDLNTCGGTHVRSTSELQALILLGTERLRGGTRLFYVAGQRVLHRLRLSEQRTRALSALLSRGSSEVVLGVEQLQAELKTLRKQLVSAQAELCDALAAQLVARGGPVRSLHRPDGDAAMLSRLAQSILREAPGATLWLTAGADKEGAFLLVTEPSRLAVLAPRVLELLEARGGGPAGRLQGKTARLDRRDEVLALLL
jgi:misacylated tRNA(Ala) deacylase